MSDGSTTTATNENKKREPFRINLTEPFKFEPMAQTDYVLSREMAAKINSLFRSVFVDFEGCTFEPGSPNGIGPYFTLAFNHGSYAEGTRRGCMPAVVQNGSSVVGMMRTHDQRNQFGDRFVLTEDAKDVIAPLLFHKQYNNGNINWNNIFSDFSEGNGYNIFHYTKVNFIDPNRVCNLLFGDKEVVTNPDTGKKETLRYEYHVQIATALWNGIGQRESNEYMLLVSKISDKRVSNIYNKLGLVGNSRIIRETE